jgi:hypothetical protein
VSLLQFKDINEINYGHDDKFIFPFLRIDKIIFIEEISQNSVNFVRETHQITQM